MLIKTSSRRTNVEVVAVLPQINLLHDKRMVTANLLYVGLVLDLPHAIILDELQKGRGLLNLHEYPHQALNNL